MTLLTALRSCASSARIGPRPARRLFSPSSISTLQGPPIQALVPPGQCQFGPEWTSVPLLEKHAVTDTTAVFRFGVPGDSSQSLGLSTCACLLAGHHLGSDHEVIRPYTPISTNAQIGSFDLLVKRYEKGSMSKYLHDELSIHDPLHFKHIDFNVKIQAPFEAPHIVMIAGGTGITPMIQALHAILGSSTITTNKVTLLYGSTTQQDILAKPLLDEWAKSFPDQLSVHYVLSAADDPQGWHGPTGYIDKAFLQEHLPATSRDTQAWVCGPPPMYESLCGPRQDSKVQGILADLGFSSEQVYKF